MFGVRRNSLIVIFLLLLLIAVSTGATAALWMKWSIFAFLFFVLIIVDFMFLSDSFLYEPSTHAAWALRNAQIKQA
jgi:hypothetical protein